MALIDNLIAYWKCDEASGNVLDAHNVGPYNCTTSIGSATGKINNCRYTTTGSGFGSTDNVFTSSDRDFSIACWFKNGYNNSGHTVCSKYYQNDDQWSEFIILWDSNSPNKFKFKVIYGGSNSVTVTSSVSFAVNTWYYVVVVHDSVNNFIGISVNGETLVTQSHSGGVNSNNDENLNFLGNSWDTYIDEVGYWNRALTQTDIDALYNSGNGLAYPFTVATKAPPPKRRSTRFFQLARY